MIRVAVMGCGGMGQKRIQALKQIEGVEYIGVSDEARYLDYESLDDILLDKPDWIIVCLPHDVAVNTVQQALTAGVKVFMEKPMGLTLAQAQHLHNCGTAREGPVGRLRVGMNYRFYPGIIALMADLDAGYFGDLISVEMTLGHGGKPGDEKTWKLDPKRNGGALLDPGIHLLDLWLQFTRRDMSAKKVSGISSTMHTMSRRVESNVFEARGTPGFWQTGITEEAHCVSLCGGCCTRITSSIVRWRNTFRIQVNGTDGYGIVERRGGNYGPQTYRRGKRWGWTKSGSHWPEDWVVRQANCESVFADELRELFFPSGKEPHVCTSVEALETMKLYDRLATIGQCGTKS